MIHKNFINCLSSSRFANLLFVNIQIGNVKATALFDTGAGMTVIAQSLLHRLRAAPKKEILCAGNNHGVVCAFQTAVIPGIQMGDICERRYGQPPEIEALLGYDFLEGRDWLLEQDFRLLP